jgi:hypothetical protein
MQNKILNFLIVSISLIVVLGFFLLLLIFLLGLGGLFFLFSISASDSVSDIENSNLPPDSNCVGLPFLDGNKTYFGEGEYELAIGNTYSTRDFNLKIKMIDDYIFSSVGAGGSRSRLITFELDSNTYFGEMKYCDVYDTFHGAEYVCSLNKAGNMIDGYSVTFVPTAVDCSKTDCSGTRESKVLCYRPTRFNIIIKKIDLDESRNFTIKESSESNFNGNCVDSDSGKEIYSKGTTTGFSRLGLPESYVADFNDLTKVTHTDQCLYNYGELEGLPLGVLEYYCDSNGFFSEESFECQYGCIDGACNPDPTEGDYNYLGLAYSTNDVNICSKIINLFLRQDCFRNIYSNLAVLNSDINVCKALENLSDQDYCVDHAYYGFAISKGDMNVCEKIVRNELKQACVYRFLGPDESACSREELDTFRCDKNYNQICRCGGQNCSNSPLNWITLQYCENGCYEYSPGKIGNGCK